MQIRYGESLSDLAVGTSQNRTKKIGVCPPKTDYLDRGEGGSLVFTTATTA